MEKDLSSLKILNIVVCIMVLVVFAVFIGIRNVKARELSIINYASIK